MFCSFGIRLFARACSVLFCSVLFLHALNVTLNCALLSLSSRALCRRANVPRRSMGRNSAVVLEWSELFER